MIPLISNKMDYVRVVLEFIACSVLLTAPKLGLGCYMVCSLWDFVDENKGRIAKTFHPKFVTAAVADQCTRRIAMCMIIMTVSTFYSESEMMWPMVGLQVIVVFDIVERWRDLYLVGGQFPQILDDDIPATLKSYYTCQISMSIVCIGSQLFFVCLFLIHMFDSELLVDLISLTWPIAFGKFSISLMQECLVSEHIHSLEQ